MKAGKQMVKLGRGAVVVMLCLLLLMSSFSGLAMEDTADAAEETAAAVDGEAAGQVEDETEAAAGEDQEEPSDEASGEQADEAAEEPLSLWTEDAAARTELLSYVEAVTDEEGEDYIPVDRRVAVFDLDGTLFCETDPNYFDYCLLEYRVLDDPDYKDQASDFERVVALKIREQNETGASFEGLEVDHGKAVASAFAGMTVEEFNAYIQRFKQQPMPSYEGMTRGDGWYLPMLQVVDYLRENDFTVYVVSGTDRFIVRGIVDGSPLGLPAWQIIGSDETLIAPDQGDTDGLSYVYDDDDALVLGGDFIVKNLKMNKVTAIAQEIGVQPVLSFGNSTGDSSMAAYVTSGNPYRSLAFMLCCDDTERENGSAEKADRMFELCGTYGWVPVSMKNDWTTIYGDGVTYLGVPQPETAEDPAAEAETRDADAYTAKLDSCVRQIRAVSDVTPEVVLVTDGSLGYPADDMEIDAEIPYEEIDGFPVPAADGDGGKLLLGTLEGVPVAVLSGRVHCYEGCGMWDVVLPLRTACLLGAKTAILITTAGAVSKDLAPGDLAVVSDHISSFIPSPLTGPNIDSLGERFVDMTQVYDEELSALVKRLGEEQGLSVSEGVLIQTAGPQYETPAEVRMFEAIGADMAGMSAVDEAIAARHMGMRVCTVALIANMAAGVEPSEVESGDAAGTAADAEAGFRGLIDSLIAELAPAED